jgi:hypothetical protein
LLKFKGFVASVPRLLKLIVAYTYIYVWEIDYFVIKSDILGGFFYFKTILKIIVLP